MPGSLCSCGTVGVLVIPALERIAEALHYADLPETWRVPEVERFSVAKTLYDYQTDALKNAARALFLYYGKEQDWTANEPQAANKRRKEYFASLYARLPADLEQYEKPIDRRNRNQNPVFKILSDYVQSGGDWIRYHEFINRMCFWMATGSGKTLVMVKLIEYLHSLQKHGEIPAHNILVLAPSEHLIRQIRKTVAEFNASGLSIDLIPLRAVQRVSQRRLGDVVTVYYHRSDNIADVQKEALTDYRTYENGGQWYILLDEAHKGGSVDSKRQAYYKVMAREGFLFNFSATFTDDEDIVTTVKKYNLEEFVKKGHGKNIYLNQQEYHAFRYRRREINHRERQKIVLKSLITLGFVSLRVTQLRADTGVENLYHLPLMLTLVNSVNTDVENEQNDLWAFFQTLREMATGELDEALFRDSKDELSNDWSHARLLFGEDGDGIIGTDGSRIADMTIADLREAVFRSRRPGGLQFIRSSDHRELAFQMKNADAPFALIRIGDTSKWRKSFLSGYEETTALQEKSFFDELESSPITILMGSRSFFESWDSNRPNVINFINIGGKDAQKFVVQSVGRGVRIETLPAMRKRLGALLPALREETRHRLEAHHDRVQPPETLFLFATNRNAVKAVLEGLETQKNASFEKLEGFEKAPIPIIGEQEMPLFIPEYREGKGGLAKSPFSMSERTLQRFRGWLEQTSDSVFAVRDGLAMSEIAGLRGMGAPAGAIKHKADKNYARLDFLQQRLLLHCRGTVQALDGVRPLASEDIVHFREICAQSEYVRELQEKINQVRQGGPSSPDRIIHWARQLANREIDLDEFNKRSSGKDEETFRDLTIRKLAGHYYLPVILGEETADYIRHIIKVPSEIEFLNHLEEWTGNNRIPWEAWMFSRIDESLDKIHIPWYDSDRNEYRRFLPDFIFWMSRGSRYRIVFVDPKGGAHTSSYSKIDGYRRLFYKDGSQTAHTFKHGKYDVSVDLFLYNPQANPLDSYRQHWIDDPGDIFKSA